jgi:hypothetical protein
VRTNPAYGDVSIKFEIRGCSLRMGVSFAFEGIGCFVGKLNIHFAIFELDNDYLVLTPAGPPINGALLTSDYVWWRPALFSGVCTIDTATPRNAF